MPGLLLSLFHAGEDIDRISWSDLCTFMQKGAGEPQQGGMSREGAEARHSPHCYLVGPSAESVHLSEESSSIMPRSEAYSGGAVRSLQDLQRLLPWRTEACSPVLQFFVLWCFLSLGAHAPVCTHVCVDVCVCT